MKKLLLLSALLAAPLYAQNAPSGSPRVQGAPDGYGDPLQVTVVGPNGADATGTTSPQVQGNAASGATDSGYPVKVGCTVLTSAPSAIYTTGQRANCSIDGYGGLRVLPGEQLTLTDGNANNGMAGFRMSNNWGPAYVAPLVFNGTSWDRQRGDTNGTPVQPALSANFWNYAAAAGGIVNTTTAVTLKTASGASVRNYLCTLTLNHDVLGAATEVAVRDGAAGTVLWRGKFQTTTTDIATGAGSITFTPCLKGTANTLLEFATLTAVTGAVFVNASGYTGS